MSSGPPGKHRAKNAIRGMSHKCPRVAIPFHAIIRQDEREFERGRARSSLKKFAKFRSRGKKCRMEMAAMDLLSNCEINRTNFEPGSHFLYLRSISKEKKRNENCSCHTTR